MLLWQRVRRIGPVGFIVLLHIGFFYALNSGLLRQAAQVLPNEVFASFITPDAPPPDSPKSAPAVPKTVPVIKSAVTPSPVAPMVNAAPPSPQSITVAPQAATPPTPAAVAVPAPSIVPAQPKTISGVAYIQAPQTEYPLLAKRAREQGKVMLRVLINEQGQPGKIEVQKSSGSERLDEAARRAVARALFKPYIEDGKALAVYAIVPINFQLDN